ncbi:GGDEF domain-containing protein [Malaciobacter mytili]|uniref:GGDEF domain-containing protein n=1 Tax=Malaciobacter mytili TaxID=603050 RepID=UPI003A8483E2
MLNKQTMILSTILLLFFGFCFTSYSSYKIAAEITKEEVKHKSLPLSSDNIYSEIQRDLIKPNLISSFMSNDTFLKNWIIDGEKNINNIKDYLEMIEKKYQASISFLVSEKTKAYYYSKGILKYVSASNERDIWFYRVKASHSDYESNIDLSLANNDALTIFTNFKIIDKNGNFLGVTGVGLETNHVANLLKQYKKKYKHDIYFVNSKYEVVLSSNDKEKIKVSKIAKLKEIIDNASLGNKEFYEYVFEDENYYLNIRYIDELDLFLFVETKEKDFLKKLNENLFSEILIVFSVVVVILIFTYFYFFTYQKNLEEFAKIDKLTSLYNRNIFDIEFVKLIEKNNKFSIILLDIDDFKFINDTYGHKIGDEILIIVSKILKATLRKDDFIARWGGEEFIILLNETSNDNLFKIADNIRVVIKENKQIRNIIKKELTVSVSIATLKDNETKDEFFIRVDKTLYKAKNKGKNRVEISE